MKQNYELSYLILGQLSQDAAAAISQQINESLQQAGGMVSESRLPQKINLAYQIKKELTAFLQTTYFGLEPEKLAEVKKKLEETKEILRFLILRKVEAKKMPVRRTPRKPLVALETTPSSSQPTPSQKVELGEIEKKLDKILK